MITATQTLEDILEFYNGKAPPKTQGGTPVFGSNGRIGTADQSNHSDGIILGRVGAYCGSVEICSGPFWATDNTIVVKPKGQNDLRYLYYRLKSMPLRSYAGGAAQPLLTQSSLKRITALIAEPKEQARIADVLSSYDHLIENNHRRIELLEQGARELYKEWFVRLRYPGHEHESIQNGLPEGWRSGVVSDLGEVVTGKTPSKKDDANFGGDVPFIKTPDMHNNPIVVVTQESLRNL